MFGTHCYSSVKPLLHLSLTYSAKPTLLLGSERIGKVGYILAFYNDREVEDVAQSSPRVVTKRTKKGQLLSDIVSNTNGFLIDFVRADSILSRENDCRQSL